MTTENEFFHLRPASGQSAITSSGHLSEVLKLQLSDLGYLVEPIQEDWGWWIAVEKRDAKMAIGVYGVDEDTSDREFAVTVFTDKVRMWILWPFLARSIEAELRVLKRELSNLLDHNTNLVIVDKTTAFPL